MSERSRIAIVGRGIAGASLAAHLAGRGHAVEGFDRSAGSESGAGLLLAPPALVLLREMGLENAACARGAMVCGLRATCAEGEPLLHWDVRRWGYPCMGLGIERRVLHELLVGATASTVTWHQGLGIDHVDAERGWVTDTDGARHGPYDLVVGSDGSGSRLRAGRPELVTRRHRYRWSALSCLMRHDAGTAASTTLEQCFRGPHHVSIWPVGATTDAGQRVCVSVNVPTLSVPRFAQADAGLAELRRIGLLDASGLAGLRPVGPWIELTAREVMLRRYFHHRLVFIGDAAHSLSPQLGQGARLALAGASNLAAALERHPVAEALADYDRRQCKLALRYQYLSRWLTPVFHSPRGSAVWIRDRILPPLARISLIERSVLRLLCSPAKAGDVADVDSPRSTSGEQGLGIALNREPRAMASSRNCDRNGARNECHR